MTSDDFKLWRSAMRLTQAEAAIELGISKQTVENYERGSRREDGRPVAIPKTTALACSALYHRIRPWDAESYKEGIFG